MLKEDYIEGFAMTNCTGLIYQSKVKNRQIEINFTGGNISSDGGVLLLREADKRLGLTNELAKIFPDKRDSDKITHTILTMLKQRIYGITSIRDKDIVNM
ncbi:transposase [Rickettsia endosymbiont of Oedothorax gibbosus]|uniref:transposase n=1 Tax=Rickettsia endosymbiont of Oedothorax gibbosus TaxID=931099 RepID=UPI0020244C54|nr:transposase [Rickettsia endosymbiont of Oedothorax gibbosus]